MKTLKSLMLASGVVLALSGCNESSNELEVAGVYSGFNNGENGNLVQVQVINEQGASPLITFWDDRDHQVSYSGKVDSFGKIAFSAVQYECQYQSSTLVCDSPFGSMEMVEEVMAEGAISDYAGRYQAMWNSELYTMILDKQGRVSLDGDLCHLEGGVTTSAEVSNLNSLSLTQDDCGAENVFGYVKFNIDNGSLYSINIQTDMPDFPQVWIR